MKRKITTLLLILTIIFAGIPIAVNADTTNYVSSYSTTYQTGIKDGIIPKSVSLEEFSKTCKEIIEPAYKAYKADGGTETFQAFAKENNYEQEEPGANDVKTTNVTAMDHPPVTSKGVLRTSAKTGYKMKAGDILIVYGTRITPRYIGHAAIATSSKYVMEMTGPKHKSEHNTKAAFFKRNTTGSKYVLVYRIKKHPHYADDASTYAYKHMYKKDRIQKYYISPRLYHKDPSYCSKFVYLSYYWGATKSSVKYLTEIHIVTPHALIGDFKGTFKPSKIHKITKY